MKYRNGQFIVLKNNKTEEEFTIKIVMYDTIQGWLGEDREHKDWNWYKLDAYTFVKQLKTDRNVLT